MVNGNHVHCILENHDRNHNQLDYNVFSFSLYVSQRIESNQQKLCAETIHFPFKLIKKVILVTSLPPNSSADFASAAVML